MKWVKLSIGVVIAVTMVGFIVTSVHSMTQEKVREEVVSFTLNVTAETYTPIKTYDDILLYGNRDGNDIFDNIIEIKYNNIVTTDYILSFDGIENIDIKSISLDDFDSITEKGVFYGIGGIFNDNDAFEITFEVTQPPQLTGVIATLLLLSPLIFTGGVLAYMLNKQEF